MIPKTLLIKVLLGAVALGAIFAGGCRVQYLMDRGKIIKLQTLNQQHLENNLELLSGIRESNKAIAKLAEISQQREAAIKAAGEEALARERSENATAIRDSEAAAADLRERLAQLPVAEACHQAWVELTK